MDSRASHDCFSGDGFSDVPASGAASDAVMFTFVGIVMVPAPCVGWTSRTRVVRGGVVTPAVNGTAISGRQGVDTLGSALATGSSGELGLIVTRCSSAISAGASSVLPLPPAPLARVQAGASPPPIGPVWSSRIGAAGLSPMAIV